MARVNTFQGGRVRLGAGTDARQRAADYGPGILPTALKTAGAALGQVSEDLDHLNAIQDEASAKEAANSVSRYFAERAHTGADPYFLKKGKAALDSSQPLRKDLDKTITDARGGLTTERQRLMFDERMGQQRLVWDTQIGQHATTEIKNYNIEQTTSHIGVIKESAKGVYLSDPTEGEAQVATAIGEVDRLAEMHGWDPETIKLEKLKVGSDIYLDVGEAILTADPTKGPLLTAKLVEQHGDKMTADARRQLLNGALAQSRMNDADQRRQEVEGRRLQREQASDARDRVESGLDLISKGIPVDAASYARLMTDAEATGDAGLVTRLQEGQFKNTLTAQYAGATPIELQNRANELSAEIARDGEKAKPEQVVERDHLLVLLSKTTAELDTDGISWGARNLKTDPGRLDLNDPASLVKRRQLAERVFQRTGRRVSPLTNEEASLFLANWRTGNPQSKAQLVSSLARFGPLASAAADMIQPGNTGFANLVALAGHSNPRVGEARVREIISGFTYFQSNPALIDNTKASREFSLKAGRWAFYFHPAVASGVLENAKAIFADDARQRGMIKWDDAYHGNRSMGERDGHRWFMAMNSALGAYSARGKQYGGLTRLNGQVTIAPEGMAIDDFANRIARANAPQFKAAHNGTPKSRDGSSPTASQIKASIWVPIRDGVYRIYDGNGFLTTKDGGFYEINARKLP